MQQMGSFSMPGKRKIVFRKFLGSGETAYQPAKRVMGLRSTGEV